MQETKTTLGRVEIRKVFKRHIGSSASVARELGVSHVTISLWLKGKTTSARVEEAARAKALQLLEQEEQQHVQQQR